MDLRMDEAISHTKLSTLADLCSDELKRHRRREPTNDRYCLEIFRRAIVERMDQAWTALQRYFGEIIRTWLHSHPSSDIALLRDSEENYIAQTFTRFWHAVREQHVEFSTLHSALSYLHATLNGIIMDTLRTHFRSKEFPLPEPGFSQEPTAEEIDESLPMWHTIQSLLPDERERRLGYLLYHCGLKPREIIIRCPHEFDDIKEIYRLNHNLIERLRRNRDRLRWLLGDEEI